MNKHKAFKLSAITLLLIAALSSCSKPVEVTGISGTGNSRVAGKIVRQDGTPATNTQVMLLKEDYNPVITTAISDSMIDTTDEAGAYAFVAEEGAYNLEAVDVSNRTRALVRDIQVQMDSAEEMVEVATTTLSAPGIIQVSLENLQPAVDGYLFIPGTSVKVQLDSSALASGTVEIDSIPTGGLPDLQYMTTRDTGTIIPVSQNLSVIAGGTVSVRKDKPVAVYYSVGVNSRALFTGDASAQNGILTLSSGAPLNVGVGDEVRAGSDKYYIARWNSSTSFALQTATGAPAPDFNQQTISIYRAFNHLNAALMAAFGDVCAADSNHLKTGDLVSGNYQLFIACYADGVDDQAVNIRGWKTSPVNYIRIFTPANATEVGVSQRHKGKWDAANGYALHVIITNVDQPAVNCCAPHIRIDGIQVLVESQLAYASGIMLYEQGNGEFDVSNSIIRGLVSSDSAGIGIYVYNRFGNGPSVRFWNNIIYDFADSLHTGIQVHSGTTSGVIANNTLVNCNSGITGALQNIYLLNNLGNGCQSLVFPWYGLNANNDYNISSSKEWDLNGVHSRDSVNIQFVDPASFDFHLATGDTAARDQGLANPVPGLFSNDIDGQTRAAPWDVGADEALP